MAKQLPWMSNTIEFSNAAYNEMFSAEKGYPQRAAEPDVGSIEGIYAKQLEQAMGVLDTSRKQAIEQAIADPQRQLALLKKQAAIDWDTTSKDRKTDAASKRTKFAALDARYQKQVAAVESKQEPNLEALQQEYEQGLQQIQRDFQRRQEHDALLKSFGDDGSMDAATVLAKRMSLATGKNFSRSDFISEPKQPTLEQQQDDLRQDITDLEGQLEHLSQFRIHDPWHGKPRWQRNVGTSRDPEWEAAGLSPEEETSIIDRRKLLETALKGRRKSLTDVIVRGDPTLQKVVQGRAAWDAASKHLNRGGTQGGGLVDLAASKPKPKLPKAQHSVGQVVQQGGKSYKITGFNANGTPIGEEIR